MNFIPKIIWIFWYTGFDTAHPVVTDCVKSWKRLNPGWDIRLLDVTNLFTLNGGLNLLPRVIADLILFRPESIKLFGVDLYTSLDYDKSYHGNKDIGWNHVLSPF